MENIKQNHTNTTEIVFENKIKLEIYDPKILNNLDNQEIYKVIIYQSNNIIEYYYKNDHINFTITNGNICIELCPQNDWNYDERSLTYNEEIEKIEIMTGQSDSYGICDEDTYTLTNKFLIEQKCEIIKTETKEIVNRFLK